MYCVYLLIPKGWIPCTGSMLDITEFHGNRGKVPRRRMWLQENRSLHLKLKCYSTFISAGTGQEATCLSHKAAVIVEGTGQVPMRSLNAGDRVLTSLVWQIWATLTGRKQPSLSES